MSQAEGAASVGPVAEAALTIRDCAFVLNWPQG